MYSWKFNTEALSFDEAISRLKQALRFGIVPMLESVEEMLEVLDHPDQHYKSIQIAGTNGKTSTARYCQALLMRSGVRAALYTSPGLVSYTDRIEIMGKTVSPVLFAEGIAQALAAADAVNDKRRQLGLDPYSITEFDLLTVAACVIYAKAEVDVVVFECGMGGRWDATSAISSIKTVGITGIGLDHMRILGDTVEKIAHEKAAIIKRGRTCALGERCAYPQSVRDVCLERCQDQSVAPVCLFADKDGCASAAGPAADPAAAPVSSSASVASGARYPKASYHIDHAPSFLCDDMVFSLTTPRASYTRLKAPKPEYQAANISLAVLLVEEFMQKALSKTVVAKVCAHMPTPGRFQILRRKPLVLIDACHNPQSVDVFLNDVKIQTSELAQEPILLCAVLADKDVDGIVERLSKVFTRVVCTQTASPRALSADALADVFKNYLGYTPKAFAHTADALHALAHEDIVAVGSITLAGEVAAYYPLEHSFE